MKTFYSATDIEAMSVQGVRELVVDENTVLTSVARELAANLGMRLVAPGRGAAARTGSEPERAVSVVPANPARPKGCQHGPIAGEPSPRSASNRPVVDDLIGAVKQYANRPGQEGAQ